jgi:hypothetical protein
MKLGMHITAAGPISTAYFINPSHHTMCTPPNVTRQRLGKCIPHFVTRQRLGKHVSAAINIRNNRRILGRLCIPLSLLSNGSVKTFPPQRRNIWGVVFHPVRVISKDFLLRMRHHQTEKYIVTQSLESFYILRSTNHNLPIEDHVDYAGLYQRKVFSLYAEKAIWHDYK